MHGRQGRRGDHQRGRRGLRHLRHPPGLDDRSRRTIGGKPVFLSYLPAGSYVGEMALIDGGRRTATVRAAIKSEVIKLDGDAFRTLLDRQARSCSTSCKRGHGRAPARSTPSSRAARTASAAPSTCTRSVASFLVANGIGEATDVLLIDEKLCVGCDNCEKACADSHEGLSRLNREAGQDLRPSPRADLVPALRASALHGRLPAQRDPSRPGRRGVHRRHLHRLRQLPAQLPLRRDPDGQACRRRSRACSPGCCSASGPGPGEPTKKWTEKQGQPGDAKEGDQMRHVLGHRGRPGLRARLPDRAPRSASSPEEFLTVARHGTRGADRGVASRGHRTAPSCGGRRRRTRASCATAAIAGSRSRRLLCLVVDPRLRARSTSQPRPNGGSWLRLYARHDRRAADPLADAARHAQARDDARALVAEGLDLRPCLSRPRR